VESLTKFFRDPAAYFPPAFRVIDASRKLFRGKWNVGRGDGPYGQKGVPGRHFDSGDGNRLGFAQASLVAVGVPRFGFPPC
jgi:hypothetical protein